MHQIDVDGLTVDVVRKRIKNLHLAVYPPNGRVRVAVPLHVDDEAVRLAVISRLAWIRKHQARFAEQERQTPRVYVDGETHYFQGDRYRLNVIVQNGPAQVVVRNKRFIDLSIRPGSTVEERAQAMSAWYRAALRERIPALIAKWELILGVQVAAWGIKKMKTKWGTCNITARRIWINLELAKKSPSCLEFVVVHEMVHLLERKHNERFQELMNTFFPQWRYYRDELNRAPLVHEEWGY